MSRYRIPEIVADEARQMAIANIRDLLEPNFQKKSASSVSKDWCNPIPLERKAAYFWKTFMIQVPFQQVTAEYAVYKKHLRI